MMNIPLPMMVVAIAGWVNAQQLAVIEYLKKENRVLGEQLGRKRPRFTDDQRRRRAAKGKVLGCRVFGELLGYAGITPVRLPPRSLDLNAYAERFVLSIKSGCLNRIVILGE